MIRAPCGSLAHSRLLTVHACYLSPSFFLSLSLSLHTRSPLPSNFCSVVSSISSSALPSSSVFLAQAAVVAAAAIISHLWQCFHSTQSPPPHGCPPLNTLDSWYIDALALSIDSHELVTQPFHHTRNRAAGRRRRMGVYASRNCAHLIRFDTRQCLLEPT